MRMMAKMIWRQVLLLIIVTSAAVALMDGGNYARYFLQQQGVGGTCNDGHISVTRLKILHSDQLQSLLCWLLHMGPALPHLGGRPSGPT